VKKALLFALFACLALSAAAQFVFPDLRPFEGEPEEVAGKLFQWYTFLFLVLGYAITYLSSRIPFLKKIDNMAGRAVIIGLILVVIFVFAGAKAGPIITAFLVLLNPYELFLKPLLGKTKTEAQVKAAKTTRAVAKKSKRADPDRDQD
jgi:hypothetical protein